jgi:hypothetical protein
MSFNYNRHFSNEFDAIANMQDFHRRINEVWLNLKKINIINAKMVYKFLKSSNPLVIIIKTRPITITAPHTIKTTKHTSFRQVCHHNTNSSTRVKSAIFSATTRKLFSPT